MRLALALLAFVLPPAALAQSVGTVPAVRGVGGVYVAPGATMQVDSSGAEKGTVANPVATRQVDLAGNPVDPNAPQPVKLADSLFLAPPAVSAVGSWQAPIFTPVDATNYTAAIINVTIAPAGGNQLVCGWSNDGAYWNPAPGYQADYVNAGGVTAFRSLSGQGAYIYPRQGRFFTCFLNAASGGAVTMNVYLQQAPVRQYPAQVQVVPGAATDGYSSYANAPMHNVGGISRGGLIDCGANAWCTVSLSRAGALITQPYGDPRFYWNYATGAITNTTTAVTLHSGVAGVNLSIAACQLSADSLAAGTSVVLRDGAGGNQLGRFWLPAGSTAPRTVSFPVPLRANIGNLVEVATETAVAGGVYVSCQGTIGL